jgi:hypothetical protein
MWYLVIPFDSPRKAVHIRLLTAKNDASGISKKN